MKPTSPLFEFRSNLFAVSPAEDGETQPGCHGKALAEWIRERFGALGYPVGEVAAQDWGWCVMLQRRPFRLWIGCRNEGWNDPPETPAGVACGSPIGPSLTWRCIIVAEVPVWTPFYWKRLLGRVDTWVEVQQAARQLEQVLVGEPRIQLELIEGL